VVPSPFVLVLVMLDIVKSLLLWPRIPSINYKGMRGFERQETFKTNNLGDIIYMPPPAPPALTATMPMLMVEINNTIY